MANQRVLAIGGDRPVLVGLARAFEANGAVFAALNDSTRLLESVERFAPALVLVFGRPSPEDAMRYVRTLRGDPHGAALPIVLVASLPPSDTRGVTSVVPDPSDVNDFALRLLQALRNLAPTPPPPPREAVDEVEEIGVVEEIPIQPSVILLVDDDPTLVKLFSTALHKNGFDILSAQDGEEGLQVALERRPDVVIADLNMPRLDGWGLLRAMRADHRIGETPLMFLSCHDDYRESLKAFEAGAQDYMAKGLKLDVLIRRVRGLLAPRDAFLGSVMAGEKVTAKVEELGVQWSLRKLGGMTASGTLHIRDPFWRIARGIQSGELVYAAAEIGKHRIDGTAALPPLAVVRSGELLFDPQSSPPTQNLRGAATLLLEEAALRNNRTEAEALDRLLTQATRVEVDEQLYQLYEQLGPPQSRDIAVLVRKGLTPREVIAASNRSPMEVEDTLRDLVRRRVITLSAK